MPTYRRPRQLHACVRAIAALRPPPGGFELIVVNDGGPEPPASLRDAATGAPESVRFVTQPNRGPGAARNHGARIARGRRIAFTDDDCLPDADWLVALDRALDRQPEALVGGRVVNALAGNLFADASQSLAAFTARYFDGDERERFFTSNNIALARNAFLDIGGFDERFGRTAGEDRELCDRWHAAGRPSRLAEQAVVAHAHALGPLSYLRQHLAYGRGSRSFRATRRDAGRPVRIDLPFYLESLRYARRSRPGLEGLAVAALTAAAHAAYLGGLAIDTLRSPADPAGSE